MNKYQDALDFIIAATNGGNGMVKELNALQELVDKATPKKVVIEEYLPVFCPHCGKELSTHLEDGYYEVPNSMITNYCKYCSGKLDWSDEDY